MSRQGEPFYVEVVIQSTRATDANVTVYRGGFKECRGNEIARRG